MGWRAAVEGIDRLSNVTIRLPSGDISDTYSETRVLLVPSRREPFGRVALEGALAGCLVLAHRDCGLAEVPLPEFCYMDDLDPAAWANRLLKLYFAALEVQDALRDEIQRMARTYDPGWARFLEVLSSRYGYSLGDAPQNRRHICDYQ
jgi:hypothetical protein